MVIRAPSYCVQMPRKSHIELFSVTMLKTVIITLQGVSALYSLIGGLVGSNSTARNVAAGLGMDVVFLPLTIIGLLRLCAAAWLTEDFAYVCLKKSAYGLPKHNDVFSDENGLLLITADDIDPWFDHTFKGRSAVSSAEFLLDELCFSNILSFDLYGDLEPCFFYGCTTK
jgi:hypothetical protein